MCNLVTQEASLLYSAGSTNVLVMQQNLIRYCGSFATSDTTACMAIVNCQVNKIFGDAKENRVTNQQTCIDIGNCEDAVCCFLRF
jgi:hypothetical protein